MNKNRLYLLLILMLLVSPTAIGGSAKIVKVSVLASDLNNTTAIEVRLFEIKMARLPEIKQIDSKTTNHPALVSFSVPASENRVFYQVSALRGDREISSEPFYLDENRTKIEVELILPAVSTDAELIEFPKNTVFVEQSDAGIAITDIIYLVNATETFVDASKFELQKKMPVGSKNFSIIHAPKRSEVEKTGDYLHLKLKLSPGQSQVIVNYELPTRGSDISMKHHLFSGTGELELVFVVGGPEINVKPDHGISTTESTKKFNNQLYVLKTLTLPQKLNLLEITISGIPLAQNQMIIPAVILAVILFAGLILYLRKGANRSRRSKILDK